MLEADIDALSSHSSEAEVWDPIGKTPEEIAALCTECERCDRRQKAKHNRIQYEDIWRASVSYYMNGFITSSHQSDAAVSSAKYPC